MKMRIAILAAAFMPLGYLPVAVAQQTQPVIPDELKVTIDAQQTADPVSKYVFGSFIEHIGTLIYRSMWAELLKPGTRWRARPSRRQSREDFSCEILELKDKLVVWRDHNGEMNQLSARAFLTKYVRQTDHKRAK